MHILFLLLKIVGQKKYSFVSGTSGGKKNSDAGGRKNITYIHLVFTKSVSFKAY